MNMAGTQYSAPFGLRRRRARRKKPQTASLPAFVGISSSSATSLREILSSSSSGLKIEYMLRRSRLRRSRSSRGAMGSNLLFKRGEPAQSVSEVGAPGVPGAPTGVGEVWGSGAGRAQDGTGARGRRFEDWLAPSGERPPHYRGPEQSGRRIHQVDDAAEGVVDHGVLHRCFDDAIEITLYHPVYCAGLSSLGGGVAHVGAGRDDPCRGRSPCDRALYALGESRAI